MIGTEFTAPTEFAEGDAVAGIRVPNRAAAHGKFVRRFGKTGAVILTDSGETQVIAQARPYTAGEQWLSGEVPEHGERTPIFDAVFEEHALDTAPEWPEPETEVLPVDRPTAEFAAVKPGVFRRFMRRLALVRWSGTRVTFGAASAVVFVVSGALWTVIR